MKKFYRNKKILVTGDTGFKGSWLCQILLELGAYVVGYGLEPPTEPALYNILSLSKKMKHYSADIRDYAILQSVLQEEKPEIVFHLAAQPIVRESYQNPKYTYETNVLGTVNICECIRNSTSVRSFLNVTTDKVYKNENYDVSFTEDMPLDGYDPYSNSKSCSELVTHSYKKSFFDQLDIRTSTARAGNVIGGGDFAKDRIIPDCVRAMKKEKMIIVRNPHAIRPYQHVLEPLYAYLMIVKEQYENPMLQGSYNVGPNDENTVTTGELADLFCSYWGKEAKWINQYDGGPYEASFLKLDCSRIKENFGWNPKWDIKQTMKKTVEWYQRYVQGENIEILTIKQIGEMFDV